jgi:hypothetical protein
MNNDQRQMRKVWRSDAWKARVKELLLAHERCEWCNGKASVINHRRQGFYPGYELCRREEVDIICQPCHLHFTKTGGGRRHRLYDSCSSCAAVIYLGRKVCWVCGDTVRALTKVNPELRKILARCPEVRVGDLWTHVWSWADAPLTVVSFKPQDGGSLPWPMVDTSLGEVGLPAFMFGELTKRGEGESWKALYGMPLSEAIPE